MIILNRQQLSLDEIAVIIIDVLALQFAPHCLLSSDEATILWYGMTTHIAEHKVSQHHGTHPKLVHSTGEHPVDCPDLIIEQR
tara:strand:- start:832 stop:1080 length:249 start_codon:yes stop_codon:yes gene_type:complete